MAYLAKRRKRDARSSDNDDQPPAKAVRLKADLISSTPQPNESKASTTARVLRGRTCPSQPRARTSYAPNQRRLTNSTRIRSGHVKEEIISTPEKPKLERKNEDGSKNTDLTSFLPRQAQQKSNPTDSQTSIWTISSRQTSTATSTAKDEMISDWEEDDLEFKTQPSSFVQKAASKRVNAESSSKPSSRNKELLNGRQKFLQAPISSVRAAEDKDFRPWAEKFAPTCLEELAVHKRKVADTRNWLEEVLSGRRKQRLLLLKGAAGTGKTTTLKLLAASMNCEILEWRNPVGSVASSDGVLSMSAQFEEFLGRGGTFGQLELSSIHENMPDKGEKTRLDRLRKIILIEEFPNTFASSSNSLQSFRSSILQFLTSNLPPVSNNFREIPIKSIIPIVMVVSETLLTTSTASADSFTAHRLLGTTLLQHPGVGIIEFNPIAPTLLAKALQLTLQKEARRSGRKKNPGPLLLKKLGEVGDIRSAIGSLEFLSLRSDINGDWGAKISFKKSGKREKTTELTTMELDSLELVTRREASLGIFHAVGKVVYNRREEQAPKLPVGHDPEQLPSFLSIHSRPKRSIVSINELIDETGTDTQTFIAALHENYLLSCEAAPSCFEFSSLDHVNSCIDALSDSDLLGSTRYGFPNSNGFNNGECHLRDEFSFQTAVRGLIFSLPHPVTRIIPAAAGFRLGKAKEAHSMFYPTILKLWRMKEDIEAIADLYVKNHMQSKDWCPMNVASGVSPFILSQTDDPESIMLKPSNRATDASPLVSTGNSARKEMLLERLPFMAQIAKSSGRGYPTSMIKNIEKVTVFTGIGRNEETPESQHPIESLGENWATDEPCDLKRTRKRVVALKENDRAGGLTFMQPVDKLLLSDDDIEDD